MEAYKVKSILSCQLMQEIVLASSCTFYGFNVQNPTDEALCSTLLSTYQIAIKDIVAAPC